MEAGTWNKSGVKIQQHYHKYGPESISTDTLQFWGLHRRVWVYTPNGRKYFPSGSVRNETEPSTPLKELLNEEAFILLGYYDQSKPDDFEEEAIKYHSEEFSPPLLLTSSAER